MSAEGELSSPTHAVVLTDVPGFASTVNMATNKSILNSLNKIDQTMGQTAPCSQVMRRSQTKRPKRIGRHQTLLSQSRTLSLAAQILKEYEKIAYQKTI